MLPLAAVVVLPTWSRAEVKASSQVCAMVRGEGDLASLNVVVLEGKEEKDV